MSKTSEVSTSRSDLDKSGRFTVLEQMRLEYPDGTQVVGPLNGSLPSAEALRVTAGDIIDIACRIFPKLCGGGGGGGGGDGCYKITLPDGTTITICPGKTAIA